MDYQSRRRKSPYRFIVWFIAFVFFLVLAGYFYWNYLISPIDQTGQLQAFVVKDGESVSQISDRLEAGNLIRSSLAFKILYKLQNNPPKIEAGDFKISASMSAQQIIDSLHKGSIDKWVRLQEGWRVEEEAKAIEKNTGIKQDDFLKYAEEGYMFPDSYLINPNTTGSDIASLLKNTFEQRYSSALRTKVKNLGLTEEQGVILASLVEREARSDQVRTQVASILLKRFKMKMALDVDSTVQYAKDSLALKTRRDVTQFWRPVTVNDYHAVVSSYNTYLNVGLPPAPICNPSLSSLTAVANADPSTPYLYYYHDSQGVSHYAKTLEEHNANVAKYK